MEIIREDTCETAAEMRRPGQVRSAAAPRANAPTRRLGTAKCQRPVFRRFKRRLGRGERVSTRLLLAAAIIRMPQCIREIDSIAEADARTWMFTGNTRTSGDVNGVLDGRAEFRDNANMITTHVAVPSVLTSSIFGRATLRDLHLFEYPDKGI